MPTNNSTINMFFFPTKKSTYLTTLGVIHNSSYSRRLTLSLRTLFNKEIEIDVESQLA